MRKSALSIIEKRIDSLELLLSHSVPKCSFDMPREFLLLAHGGEDGDNDEGALRMGEIGTSPDGPPMG
jgi:hypothetical protein